MDAINFGDDVFTFIVGTPWNPLQTGYSTIRNILVPIWVVIYSCVHTFPDKDYLLCIVLENKTGTENSSEVATHFIHNVDGKFSVHPNLPYITNACKQHVWWSMNLTFMLCSFLISYPIILLIVRRALDYFLDFRKVALLKLVAELDCEYAHDLYQAEINITDDQSEDSESGRAIKSITTTKTTTTISEEEKKKLHRIIRGIDNEIVDKEKSFFAYEFMKILLGIVGHVIVIISSVILFYWFKYSSEFDCSNPGMSFPDKKTFVKCSLKEDRMFNVLFCSVTAFCYVIFDLIAAVIDMARKYYLWQLLSKSEPSKFSRLVDFICCKQHKKQQKITQEADGEEGLSHEADAQEKISQEVDGQEGLSHEADAQEKISQEADGQEGLSHEADAQEKISQEVDGQDDLSQESDEQQRLLQEADGQQISVRKKPILSLHVSKISSGEIDKIIKSLRYIIGCRRDARPTKVKVSDGPGELAIPRASDRQRSTASDQPITAPEPPRAANQRPARQTAVSDSENIAQTINQTITPTTQKISKSKGLRKNDDSSRKKKTESESSSTGSSSTGSLKKVIIHQPTHTDPNETKNKKKGSSWLSTLRSLSCVEPQTHQSAPESKDAY